MPITDDERTRLLTIYRDRVTHLTGVHEDYPDKWVAWCRRLLQYGGELVVPPLHPESDLDELLHGAREVTVGSRLAEGDANACHANAARVWIDGSVPAIGTGYALTQDLWRQHSWGIDAEGMVVETTVPRERYVGLTLGETECVAFAVNNNAAHLKSALAARDARASVLRELITAAYA